MNQVHATPPTSPTSVDGSKTPTEAESPSVRALRRRATQLRLRPPDPPPVRASVQPPVAGEIDVPEHRRWWRWAVTAIVVAAALAAVIRAAVP